MSCESLKNHRMMHADDVYMHLTLVMTGAPELKESLTVLLDRLGDPHDQARVVEDACLIMMYRDARDKAATAQQSGGLKPQELHNLKSRAKALDKVRLLAEMEISDICRPLGLVNPFI